MLHPKKRAAIEQQIAQCPAAKRGDKPDDEYADRIEFVLLCADETWDAKGDDADGFDPRNELDDGGREHDSPF